MDLFVPSEVATTAVPEQVAVPDVRVADVGVDVELTPLVKIVNAVPEDKVLTADNGTVAVAPSPPPPENVTVHVEPGDPAADPPEV